MDGPKDFDPMKGQIFEEPEQTKEDFDSYLNDQSRWDYGCDIESLFPDITSVESGWKMLDDNANDNGRSSPADSGFSQDSGTESDLDSGPETESASPQNVEPQPSTSECHPDRFSGNLIPIPKKVQIVNNAEKTGAKKRIFYVK